MSPPPSRRFRWTDLVVVLCLILAAWRLTASVESSVDLGLDDETSYLKGGLRLAEDGLPGAQWGPLYSLWYSALHRIVRDPVQLYYANYCVLAALSTLALYVAARAVGMRPMFALLLAFVFLISSAPHLWPHVSHLALISVLAGLAVAACARAAAASAGLLALGFLLGSFCRPELFVAFLGALVWMAVKAVRSARDGVIAGTFAVAFAALIAAFGNPIAKDSDSDRSMIAFAQHYTLNFYRRSGSAENPWTTAGDVMQRQFGSPQSLREAIAHNPGEFARHVADNARLTPVAMRRLVLVSWSAAAGLRTNTVLRGIELALLIGATAWALAKTRRRSEPLTQSHRTTLLALGLCAAATMPAILLVHPRDHYLLVLCMLLLCAAFLWMNAAWPDEPRFVTPLMAILVVLGVPDHFAGWRRAAPPRPRPNVTTVRFIDSLDLQQGFRLLEVEVGSDAYLRTRCTSTAAHEKLPGESLRDFIARKSIAAILLSESLANDVRYRNDPDFRALLEKPAEFDFEALAIPDTGRTLFLRRGLRQ